MGKYLDGSGVSHLWTLITQTFAKKTDIPEGAQASTTTPKVDGTAAVGTETAFARGDHVHPTDTSRQAAITSSSKLSADLISDGTTNKVVTATEKTTWNNKYSKPSGGITKDDLTSAVQTSLGKADTALQSETDPVFTASAAHGITSTDISNWNAAEANVVKSVNTTAGTSGVNLSLTSGALDVTISSGSVASGNSNFVTGGAVYDAIAAAQVGAAVFQGVAPTTFAPTNYKKGWYWIVNTAGTYAGHTCEIGDMIFCINNYSSAYSASDFSVVQNDIDRLGDNDIDAAIANANT